MSFNRREFLIFLGAGAGLTATGLGSQFSMPFMDGAEAASGLSFKPIQGPMPLLTDGITLAEQAAAYAAFEIKDDVVLPEGFTYDVVASWGDKVGDSHFGYNNDFLSFVETGKGEGFLSVNHEYVSYTPWEQTYEEVIGKSLPFVEVRSAVEAAGEEGINAFALDDTDEKKANLVALTKAALAELGLSVISVKRQNDGSWMRTNSKMDRRISGISGLEDGRYLKASGPASVIFNKATKKGYDDQLGGKIIGTFNNCAGGTSPWGTVFSAEENFQDVVPEGVMADGSSLDPSKKPVTIDEEGLSGYGNPLGLAGNKYGWMVEVDPANPNDYGVKHTWLGRYRHEAVAFKVIAGKSMAIYSGCDRRSGHLYKFVSQDPVKDITDKKNSGLLSRGMLYAAKFEDDGTGYWIPLKPETAVDPVLPSQVHGSLVTLPKRPEGGVTKIKEDAEAAEFKKQFATLADLYEGDDQEKQGAILIDAHYAANAAGATCTARPEDTDIDPKTGALFIAFTSGSPGSDGGADKAVFSKAGKVWEYGWVVKLEEADNDPAAMTFKWSNFAVGGEPTEGGLGFANPDNLEFDKNGHLWVVTDMSSDRLNKAVPEGRKDKEGKNISQSSLRALYGNNSMWFMPTSGSNAGKAFLFGYGPMDCEVTGPLFTRDQQTLFAAVQHPGEVGGRRKDGESKERELEMKTTDGKTFMQKRQVPIGSNWPSGGRNMPPKPSVIAIHRANTKPFA